MNAPMRGTAMNGTILIDPVADAESMPRDQIDVSDPKLYQDYIWQPYFARLRRDDPVHWRENAMYGCVSSQGWCVQQEINLPGEESGAP